MSVGDLMKFEIENGAVVAVYEFDDGRWEYEPMEPDETYTLSGNEVIKQEPDDGFLETTRYRDRGDGVHVEMEETRTRLDSGTAGPDTGTLLPDTQDAELVRLYLAVLDREPDAEGFRYWEDRMDAGLSLERLVDHFIASDEFQSRYAGTDNTGFVTGLYENVLDRQPDAAGLEWWTEQLESGARDRDELVLGFMQSEEFIASTEPVVQNFLLGMQADILIV